MADADHGALVDAGTVEVVLALPRWQQVITLALDPLTPLLAREAVQRAIDHGLDCAVAGIEPASVPIGVYGEPVADDCPLQPGDRLELYRPLLVDPKERRRREAAARPPGRAR